MLEEADHPVDGSLNISRATPCEDQTKQQAPNTRTHPSPISQLER